MNTLSPKDRMKISRQPMTEQDAEARAHNFEEVNLGYDEQAALLEAVRCLDCKDPKCVEGCPVHVQIPKFIEKLVDKDYMAAAETILQDNMLPAICGRVCPQENQCESRCILAKKGISVAIGNLERFAMDVTADERARKALSAAPAPTGRKVALIGSGPSSLTCAGDLVRLGHDVTIFEALHDFGGVLIYGIPQFRLPKEIVRFEVDQLRRMGVKFEKNVVIGMSLTIDELMHKMGFDAVFIGVGAGLPYFLGIPGEDLIGIYSSNELLTRVNLMKAYQEDFETVVFDYKDKTVAVFGAGNTALDSARTVLRLGAKKVYIIYRRSEAEMPARKEEVHHAKQEGIEFLFLNNPLEFIGDENGWLKSVRLQKMELGEPDASGRRKPVPIEGSEYTMELDMAVVAIGNGSNPIIQNTTPDLQFNRRGTIVVDENTLQSSRPGVFAGGDIVTGGATVILAMGAGRKAAASIHEYLMGLKK